MASGGSIPTKESAWLSAHRAVCDTSPGTWIETQLFSDRRAAELQRNLPRAVRMGRALDAGSSLASGPRKALTRLLHEALRGCSAKQHSSWRICQRYTNIMNCMGGKQLMKRIF